MKFILITLATAVFSFKSISQESEGIKFETGTWAEILEIAKTQNKLIFVDAYTTWCGPCKWMSKNTFTDKKVGDFVNANFVPYKMDMEKGEGIDFAKANEVRAYPTLLFFNAQGELVHRGLGAQNAEVFLQLCTNAVNPEKQLATYKNKFIGGNEDKEFLVEYIEVAQSAGEPTEEVFDKYWSLLNKEEKITQVNLDFMRSITNGFNDLKSDYFAFVKKNKNAFIEVMGSAEFSPYWMQAYSGAIWRAAAEKNEKIQKKKLKQTKSVFKEYSKEADAFFEMNKAWQSKNQEDIEKATVVYIELTTDWQFLNSNAWNVYENSSSNEELEKALGWIDRSVTINANFFNLDTKGAILFKLKKFEEAKSTLEEAIAKKTEFTAEDALKTTQNMLSEVEKILETKN